MARLKGISLIPYLYMYIICFSIPYIHAHITYLTLKAKNNKEIVESGTTSNFYASNLLRCAAACSMRGKDCCALSYSNQKCRLDSSCQYTTKENVDSKVLYLNDSIDETTASVTTKQTQSTPASCDGCLPFGSSNYLFVHTAVSYAVAQADCHARGGKLPEIETAEENTFLRDNCMTVFGQRSWIGALSYTGSGNAPTDFRWNSSPSQQMVFTDWNSGEPDGDDCVIVTSNNDAYRWASVPCEGSHFYTCEFQ